MQPPTYTSGQGILRARGGSSVLDHVPDRVGTVFSAHAEVVPTGASPRSKLM